MTRRWLIRALHPRPGMWRRKLGIGLLVSLSFFIVLVVFDDVFRNAVGVGRISYNVPVYLEEKDIAAVNCQYLFNGNITEIQRAKYKMARDYDYRANMDDAYLRTGTNDCSKFKQDRLYIMDVSKEEEDFPIAFSIVLYKDAQQAERLLRAVYRPNNHYCIHVDAKAPPSVHAGMRKLTECFDNVNMASKTLDVVWGEFSVLEAELVCINDLLRYKKWKYFINLTGQEYPLKTNLQLVRILKAYNGANDIDATVSRYFENLRRWWPAGSPPHGIRPVQGAVHIIANRDFVDYAINNQVAKDLLNWVKQTKIPDETFFSTLNHNPQLQIPGTYIGVPETHPKIKPFLARYKIWDNGVHFFMDDCQGKYVHHICIFGVGDLSRFQKRQELFANKFHIDFEPIVYECMEERYFTAVKEEQRGVVDFDITFYRSVGFVLHQVKPRLDAL
ncbi:beta-1,3-galactosyl-O-glycosyl-glycoprotein beta-1,6-N-acetylglucosaminyltransferase-like isoform X1 [Haliotis rufescens]|uniref:beta-1,3-galactosyl-O-glycosyl-glycoprotein beta-1,6-N-acetylglucosaminyltransferase-like isoform X1 n=2 Tax=Haliotis rufescens TaxID=6454 RepID=UPI001EAFD971|nr:beta-1,3-galactosyl-O-glycosyl-glycoprotein beta-1,6-N-acetylglucosaminyltransferase-like isoform X1 [Haliotis rufescens]